MIAPGRSMHGTRAVTALALTLTLIVLTVAGPARADDGLQATGHVPSAARGPTVAVALGAGYGYSREILEGTDAHHRVGGGLAVAWRVIPWLELGLDLRGRYDKHTGDLTDDGLIGEPRMWLRASRAIGPATWLGARVGVWLPGGEAPSIQLDATTVDVAGLVTWAPAATRLQALLGFRLDRSRYAIDATTLSMPDRVGLGWSDSDALLIGVEASRRIGAWQPRVELSGELRVRAPSTNVTGADAMASAANSPARLELGVRRRLTSALTVEVAADLGLSERPSIYALTAHALVAVEPRLAATVGLSWRPAPPVRRAVVVVPEVVVTPPVDEPPPPPPPPATGTLRGRIVDDGGPLDGAHVTIGQLGAVTGVDGTFAIPGLAPGEVEVVIERDGHEPIRTTVTIVADGVDGPAPALGDVTLARVRPPSQIRGLVRDAVGRGVAATVRVEELSREVVAAADGTFAIDVPPGTYHVVVTMAGFRTQTRTYAVEVDGVTIANIDLRR